MPLHTLRPNDGSTKNRKRYGRGPGSGHGKTSTKGHKGAKARSGYSLRPGFEGGQMPLHRRLPKGGFNNPFRVDNQVVNLRDLERVPGTEITIDALVEAGLVTARGGKVKLLGVGEVKRALTVRVNLISESAKASIEAAGGKVEVI